MRAIAGGEEYVGSLQQVEILFNRVPNVQGIRAVYNLIELTRKYSRQYVYAFSDRNSDSDLSRFGVSRALPGNFEYHHVQSDCDRGMLS